MSDIIFNGLIGLLVLFTCLPIHECAHAWVANKMGDGTAKAMGRITLNPFAHLDLLGSICLLISSISGIGFGWAKPVQVNPNNFKNPKLGMGLTALAGPLSNFLLAYILMVIYKLVFFLAGISVAKDYIELILYYMILLNIGLTVFNFIPIPPLDGSKIIMSLLPKKLYYKLQFSDKFERNMQVIHFVFLLLILSNKLDFALAYLQRTVFGALDFLTKFIDLVFIHILKG